MEIKLFIGEEEKTFVVPFIKGRMFRRVLEISNKHDLNNVTPEILDVLVDFVVECFNGKFSREEFYDGIDAENMIETILGFMQKISGASNVGGGDPNILKG